MFFGFMDADYFTPATVDPKIGHFELQQVRWRMKDGQNSFNETQIPVENVDLE